MSASKVLVICVVIGFVAHVSSHPVKRSAEIQESSYTYLLPKPINAEDMIDIKIIVPIEYLKKFEPFSISLMKNNTDTVCTLIIKDPNEVQSNETNSMTIEESWKTFEKNKNEVNIELIIGFAIRETRTTGQVDTIQIVDSDKEIKCIQDITDIKYLNITGQGLKVSELKFIYF